MKFIKANEIYNFFLNPLRLITKKSIIYQWDNQSKILKSENNISKVLFYLIKNSINFAW